MNRARWAMSLVGFLAQMWVTEPAKADVVLVGEGRAGIVVLPADVKGQPKTL